MIHASTNIANRSVIGLLNTTALLRWNVRRLASPTRIDMKHPIDFKLITAIILLMLAAVVLSLKAVEPTKTLNLKLDWKGPDGWQTNGAVFNIRWYSGSWLGDYNTWPVIRSVTNSVSTTLTNVSPTQLYAITLRCQNGDTSSFVGPVTAKYEWQ